MELGILANMACKVEELFAKLEMGLSHTYPVQHMYNLTCLLAEVFSTYTHTVYNSFGILLSQFRICYGGFRTVPSKSKTCDI